MTTVINGESLGWKYPGVNGISMKANVITAWPESLPTLTQALIDSIDAEYVVIKSIDGIEAKAHEDVVSLIPDWKQKNKIVEGLLEIIALCIEKGLFTQSELEARPIAAGLLDDWDNVKAIITKADDDEAKL